MTGEAVEQLGMNVKWLGLFTCAMMRRLQRKVDITAIVGSHIMRRLKAQVLYHVLQREHVCYLLVCRTLALQEVACEQVISVAKDPNEIVQNPYAATL